MTRPARKPDDTRCPHCGLFFMSKAQRDRHVEKRHGAIPVPERRDDGCGNLPTGL